MSFVDRMTAGLPVGFLEHQLPGVVRPVVLDTNVLLMMFRYYLRKHGRSALLTAARAGTLKFFAAKHVAEEMSEKLPRLVRKWGFETDVAVVTYYREFAPWIRFVDVSGIEPSEPRFGTVGDADDRPTAILAGLLAPAIVLSRDPDLVEIELAYADWLPAVVAGARLGDFATGGYGLLLMLNLTLRGSAAAVIGIRHHRRVAVVVSGLALFGMAILTAMGRVRLDRGAVSGAASAVLEGANNAMGGAIAAARIQAERLDAATVGRGTVPSTIDQLSRLVALEPVARSARQIATALESTGLVLADKELDTLLEDRAAFVRDGRWGWRLGHLVATGDS